MKMSSQFIANSKCFSLKIIIKNTYKNFKNSKVVIK